MAPEHLSLYALTLEDGTPLTRDVERGRAQGPDLDLQADMFEWSRERMASAGFQHYEVSNWSLPGRECRHNLAYWHNADWLGLGSGAHSHLYNERFADAASPRNYTRLVDEAAAHGMKPEAPLESMKQVTFRELEDRSRDMSETVILALRLRRGLELASFKARYGVEVSQAFPGPLEETLSLGLTEIVNGYLRLRDEAVMVGDEAFLRFLPDEA